MFFLTHPNAGLESCEPLWCHWKRWDVGWLWRCVMFFCANRCIKNLSIIPWGSTFVCTFGIPEVVVGLHCVMIIALLLCRIQGVEVEVPNSLRMLNYWILCKSCSKLSLCALCMHLQEPRVRKVDLAAAGGGEKIYEIQHSDYRTDFQVEYLRKQPGGRIIPDCESRDLWFSFDIWR